METSVDLIHEDTSQPQPCGNGPCQATNDNIPRDSIRPSSANSGIRNQGRKLNGFILYEGSFGSMEGF